ncbi:MAG: zinc-binding dehydrogenase [Candidatus Promineifilaceae bacterium]|nr:zinc-binding dehydrogenase [Candidatus Promineifilaceae bacterium]
MRAVVLPEFGGADLMEVKDVERPAPGPNDLLVRVRASATNPVEAKLRAAGQWARVTPPIIIGYDAAGTVEEVGAGVVDFEPGDDVYYTPHIFGNPQGTHAEYNVVPANIVARKPAGLSYAEAAAIPLAGGTAWEAVIRRLQIRPGESLLIQGGAGGVGSFAVQFAKAAGARVLATAGSDNQETLRTLGADVAIDYTSQDVVEAVREATGGAGVDAVLEISGENLVARSLPAVHPFGRIATILPPQGNLATLYRNNITLFGVFLTRERVRLDEMRPLFERGEVKPLIAQTLPLREVAKAHERLESGHGRGKVVLEVE